MLSHNNIISLFCPAKVNLTLSVIKPRADGFHELISLVGLIKFGDDLELTIHPHAGSHTFHCSAPGISSGTDNLIIKALNLFSEKTGILFHADITLIKRIPVGGGLGGGSSNAAIALQAINTFFKDPLSSEELLSCAALIGSDCPLFLQKGFSIMRGRGEVVVPVSGTVDKSIRICLFQPPFPIHTKLAFAAMRENPAYYLFEEKAEACLNKFLSQFSLDKINLVNLAPQNNMEIIMASKYFAIKTLLQEIRNRFSVPCAMSGSGSVCYFLYKEGDYIGEIQSFIKMAWGEESFIQETSFIY